MWEVMKITEIKKNLKFNIKRLWEKLFE